MRYLNILVSNLMSEEFIGSTPTNRATWLCLMRYCAVRENGGIIRDCGDWPNRKWVQICGVGKAEVEKPSKLWKRKNGKIVLKFYPKPQEKVTKILRKSGKLYGRGHPKHHDTTGANGDSPANSMANSTAKDKDKDKDKDKIYTLTARAREGDLEALAGDIRKAKREFEAMHEMAIINELRLARDEGHDIVANTEQFLVDMANSISLPAHPLSKLRNYLSFRKKTSGLNGCSAGIQKKDLAKPVMGEWGKGKQRKGERQ